MARSEDDELDTEIETAAQKKARHNALSVARRDAALKKARESLAAKRAAAKAAKAPKPEPATVVHVEQSAVAPTARVMPQLPLASQTKALRWDKGPNGHLVQVED